MLKNIGITLIVDDSSYKTYSPSSTPASVRPGYDLLKRCGSIVGGDAKANETAQEPNWLTMYFTEEDYRIWNPNQQELVDFEEKYSTTVGRDIFVGWNPVGKYRELYDGDFDSYLAYCRFTGGYRSSLCRDRCRGVRRPEFMTSDTSVATCTDNTKLIKAGSNVLNDPTLSELGLKTSASS
jgi:hypothetical protein